MLEKRSQTENLEKNRAEQSGTEQIIHRGPHTDTGEGRELHTGA